jgi:hypothetical protein
MKHLLASIAFVAALAPAAAHADPTSAALNVFTAEQALDCITTMAVLHQGGHENNPLAAPFTHSALTELGAAALMNVAARRMPLRILKTVVYVYPVILFGNVRALGAQSQTAGLVPGGVTTGIGIRPRH